jgi:hypothetical protein
MAPLPKKSPDLGNGSPVPRALMYVASLRTSDIIIIIKTKTIGDGREEEDRREETEETAETEETEETEATDTNEP